MLPIDDRSWVGRAVLNGELQYLRLDNWTYSPEDTFELCHSCGDVGSLPCMTQIHLQCFALLNQFGYRFPMDTVQDPELQPAGHVLGPKKPQPLLSDICCCAVSVIAWYILPSKKTQCPVEGNMLLNAHLAWSS